MDGKFTDFLKHLLSQREIPLIVARDDLELYQFQARLDEQDFKKTSTIEELLQKVQHPSKNYLVVNHDMQKELYDFILQYPTGQIEIFDKDKFQSKSISPLYRDVSIVMLTTKQTLMNIQKKGYKLLDNVGITYQN